MRSFSFHYIVNSFIVVVFSFVVLLVASTVHLRSDYPQFIKSYLKEINDIMKTILGLNPHDFFTSNSSIPLLELLFCTITTLHTIIDENCDPAYALFEETVTNGIHSIKCIPEFVEFLSLLQVWFILL